MALPSFLQSCLWSYDLSRLNKEKDHRLIITQVLNYGDRKQLKWLQKNYSPEKIKETILHPQRGVWLRKNLRQWLGFFNLMIDPLDFESGIRHLNPWPSLYTAFFARKEL